MEQKALAPDASSVGDGGRRNNASATPAVPLAATKGGEPPALRSSEVGISIPFSRLQKWVNRSWNRKFESSGYYFSITDRDKEDIDAAGGVAARITLYDGSKVDSPVSGRICWIRKVKRRPNAWEVLIEVTKTRREANRTFHRKGDKVWHRGFNKGLRRG